MTGNTSTEINIELDKPEPEVWIEEHGDQLFQYALSRVRDRTLAEDLVQDTLLSALKSYKNFQGRSTIKTWLIAILKNKIIDQIRKKSRQKEDLGSKDDISELPAIGFGSHGIWNVYVPNWAGSPDKVLEDQEFLNALRGCFQKLPERSRRAFELKLMEDKDSEEICKDLDIGQSNLWVILHRARLALRECIELNWYRK